MIWILGLALLVVVRLVASLVKTANRVGDLKLLLERAERQRDDYKVALQNIAKLPISIEQAKEIASKKLEHQ